MNCNYGITEIISLAMGVCATSIFWGDFVELHMTKVEMLFFCIANFLGFMIIMIINGEKVPHLYNLIAYLFNS